VKRNSPFQVESDPVHRTDGSRAAAPRKPYQPPRVIHEAELEVRAGSPLLAPDDPKSGKPWAQDYGQQSFP